MESELPIIPLDRQLKLTIPNRSGDAELNPDPIPSLFIAWLPPHPRLPILLSMANLELRYLFWAPSFLVFRRRLAPVAGSGSDHLARFLLGLFGPSLASFSNTL